MNRCANILYQLCRLGLVSLGHCHSVVLCSVVWFCYVTCSLVLFQVMIKVGTYTHTYKKKGRYIYIQGECSIVWLCIVLCGHDQGRDRYIQGECGIVWFCIV